MQVEGERLTELFTSLEGILLLLFLALGFLAGYLLALLLHRARIRALEKSLGSDARALASDDAAIAGLQGRQVELQGTLEERDRELQRLRGELAQARETIRKVEADKDQLYNEIYAINAEVEKLNAAEASYAATIDQLNQQVHELKVKNETLEEIGQANLMPAPAAEPSAEERALQERLHAALEEVEALQQENAGLRQEMVRPADDGFGLQPFTPANGNPSPAALVSARDDLTLIKGIGPSLHRRLNALDIRRFEDISALDAQRRAQLTRELRLVQGRIEAEDWVGQARRLQAMKLNHPESFRQLAKHPTDNSRLQVIEGIGPQIEELLHQGGIQTWDQLADAPVERLRSILHDSGSTFQTHDPATWPIQAALAANGHWKLLEAYQDRLQGGRDQRSS